MRASHLWRHIMTYEIDCNVISRRQLKQVRHEVHVWDLVAFIWRQFHRKFEIYLFLILSRSLTINNLRLQLYLPWGQWVNSLWPSDATWQHIYGSRLAQAMAWCRQAPSHYLNQCWLLISEVLWHSPLSNFTVSDEATILYNEFDHYTLLTTPSPRHQWVNAGLLYSHPDPYTACLSISHISPALLPKWFITGHHVYSHFWSACSPPGQITYQGTFIC